jgi:hypothetical protein
MKMIDLEIELNHEIEWRTNEISIVKTIPFVYPFSSQQEEVIKKHTIPIFYSLWEGFVVESFTIYIREINKLKLQKDNMCLNLLTHSIDINHQLKNGKMDFSKQISFVESLNNFLLGEIEIPAIIPTDSNVNIKVINNLLKRFNLQDLPEKPYKKWLDKLLFFRNKLSHGEYSSITITQPIIDEMSYIVISSMHEVANKIIEGYTNKTYLR